MEITIHQSFLPHSDPDASIAFYRDVLDFEVRLDVGAGDMRFITVGPPGQPDTAIVLQPPAPDPSIQTVGPRGTPLWRNVPRTPAPTTVLWKLRHSRTVGRR